VNKAVAAFRQDHGRGIMIHVTSQRAEDGLRVVISKTLRTFANGIRQMPASNVPIYAMKEVAQAVRGARSNMTPTMNNNLEINGSVSLISDICGCGETHSRVLKGCVFLWY